MKALLLRFIIVLFAAPYLMLTETSAQQKVDIRGYYPGMDIRSFLKNPPVAFNCLGDSPLSCQNSTTQQTFHFYFAQFLSPPVLWRITYFFPAATDGDTLMSQISATYKKETINLNGQEEEFAIFDYDFAFRDGFIAWHLTDKIFLALTRRGDSREGIPIWVLTVWDSQLDQKNKTAREELKKRLAPVPKF